MIIKRSFIKAALSLALGASLLSLAPEILADQSRPLIAGQHTEVGFVTLSAEGSLVRVDYTITEPGWCLDATHLYVGENPPQTNAPGQFPYAHSNLSCAQSDSYLSPENIPLDFCNYVAAHAVVTQQPALPLGGQVTYKVSHPYPYNMNNIFLGEIKTSPDGEWQDYVSHCVDMEHYIDANPDGGYTEYSCTLYSSLDASALAGKVDKPENLDSLNYLLNHQAEYMAAGTDLGGLGLGPATQQNVIRAIYRLIDNYYDGTPETNLKVQYMVDQAHANDGFVPGISDIMGVVVDCGSNVQVTMIEAIRGEVEVSTGSATAWAQIEGDFPLPNKGKGGWGTYFACSLPQM